MQSFDLSFVSSRASRSRFKPYLADVARSSIYRRATIRRRHPRTGRPKCDYHLRDSTQKCRFVALHLEQSSMRIDRHCQHRQKTASSRMACKVVENRPNHENSHCLPLFAQLAKEGQGHTRPLLRPTPLKFQPIPLATAPLTFPPHHQSIRRWPDLRMLLLRLETGCAYATYFPIEYESVLFTTVPRQGPR